MKSPNPETMLALHLANIALGKGEIHGAGLAMTACRAVCIAGQVRRLVEASCNAELTPRQSKRLDSLQNRADELLKPYGLELGRPWGLCHYAVPVGHDGSSERGCIFLA